MAQILKFTYPYTLDRSDALDYMLMSSSNFVESETNPGDIFWINDSGVLTKFIGINDFDGSLRGERVNVLEFPSKVYKSRKKPGYADLYLLNNTEENPFIYIGDTPPPIPASECMHEWVEKPLLTSVFYDCKKCGSKKEDC